MSLVQFFAAPAELPADTTQAFLLLWLEDAHFFLDRPGMLRENSFDQPPALRRQVNQNHPAIIFLPLAPHPTMLF
jgi:hypothetical protein